MMWRMRRTISCKPILMFNEECQEGGTDLPGEVEKGLPGEEEEESLYGDEHLLPGEEFLVEDQDCLDHDVEDGDGDKEKTRQTSVC